MVQAAHPDRDVASTAFASAGLLTAPVYLKWALLYEDVATKTVWVGKALPREWLGEAESAVVVKRAPTRYGRIGFRLKSAHLRGAFVVSVNLTLEARFVLPASRPAGGLRLRLRAPEPHAGRLRAATVGGADWPHIDAAAETVDFAAEALGVLAHSPQILATFG